MKRCANCAHYRGWYERCASPWKAVMTHPDSGEMCERWIGKVNDLEMEKVHADGDRAI